MTLKPRNKNTISLKIMFTYRSVLATYCCYYLQKTVFSCIFGNNRTILQKINVKTIRLVSGAGIRTNNLFCFPPPLTTTRQGIQPFIILILLHTQTHRASVSDKLTQLGQLWWGVITWPFNANKFSFGRSFITFKTEVWHGRALRANGNNLRRIIDKNVHRRG